jgi:PKD domain-containing protein
VEVEGGAVLAGGASAVSSGPLTARFTLGLTPAWTTNGPLGIAEQLNFGDGTPLVITRATSVQHVYRTAGQYTVQYASSGGCCSEEISSVQVVVGADYMPVTPVRILDTRTGTGKAAPIAAGGTLTLPITSISASRPPISPPWS